MIYVDFLHQTNGRANRHWTSTPPGDSFFREILQQAGYATDRSTHKVRRSRANLSARCARPPSPVGRHPVAGQPGWRAGLTARRYRGECNHG